MRENLDSFCIEYSGNGPSGVCILTASPLKQGMSRTVNDRVGRSPLVRTVIVLMIWARYTVLISSADSTETSYQYNSLHMTATGITNV